MIGPVCIQNTIIGLSFLKINVKPGDGMKLYFAKSVLMVSITLSGSLLAQESAPNPVLPDSSQVGAGVSSYPSEFFTDQSLVTALDLVTYIPGFTFRGGDNTRGFSDAAGNVLIDGRRPSAKTIGLRQMLRRIPASAVERVDIIRGGAPGIDMQGQPVIANIVRRGGASSMGSLEAMAKVYSQGEPGRTFRAEQSRQANILALEGALELRQEQDQDESGKGRVVRRTTSGGVLQQGNYVADIWTSALNASGAAAWDTSSGLLRLNIGLGHDEDDENESTRFQGAFGLISEELVARERISSRIEAGGDFTRDLGQSDSIEIIALQSLEVESDDASRRRGSELQLATEKAREGETILRGIWRRQLSPSMNIETGAEGAYNFLDSSSELVRDGIVVDLPSANVLVEELRSEIFGSLMLRPTDSLSVGVGLRVETSKITVSGGADAANRFNYLKPRVVAAYTAAGDRQLRVGIEREVGQLDFGDFAAGSEFSSNTVNAGNPDLAPEEAWVLELGYEQPIFRDGAFALTWRHSEVDKVIDLIPISGFAAPGNIGGGNREELVLSITLPFDRVGPGLGRLQMDATWRDSEVTDPVTGERRAISNEVPFQGEITYTRDFPTLNGSLGIRGDVGTRKTAYRIDQIIRERATGYWRVYWDWRPRADINVRTQLENFSSRDFRRSRDIYEDTRAEGQLAATEVRSAAFDPFLMVRVRWNF